MMNSVAKIGCILIFGLVTSACLGTAEELSDNTPEAIGGGGEGDPLAGCVKYEPSAWVHETGSTDAFAHSNLHRLKLDVSDEQTVYVTVPAATSGDTTLTTAHQYTAVKNAKFVIEKNHAFRDDFASAPAYEGSTYARSNRVGLRFDSTVAGLHGSIYSIDYKSFQVFVCSMFQVVTKTPLGKKP